MKVLDVAFYFAITFIILMFVSIGIGAIWFQIERPDLPTQRADYE